MVRRRRAVWAVAVALAVAIGAVGVPARAEPVSLASDDPVALFVRGNELFDAKDYANAYAYYEKSHRLRPSYDSASNAGTCAYKMGRYADAARLLRYGLAHIPGSLDPAKRQTAETRLTELLTDASRHIGVITVHLAPRGAVLYVDGADAGTAPLESELFLDPGHHVLIGRLDGHPDLQRELDVVAGQTGVLEMALTSGASGKVASSKPSVAVLVVGSVLGAGFVGTGIGLFAVSLGKGSDREALGGTLSGTNPCGAGSPYPNECAQIRSLSADENTFRAVGITGIVVGGATAVATLLYGVWPRPRASATQPVGSFGVTLSRSFRSSTPRGAECR
ncbi:MAG: PEGA domain-containing protein [Polyangiaceae bacterium]